jgi:hypothetical protein
MIPQFSVGLLTSRPTSPLSRAIAGPEPHRCVRVPDVYRSHQSPQLSTRRCGVRAALAPEFSGPEPPATERDSHAHLG